MPGIIEKAIYAGSDDAQKYLKRVDRNKHVQGGYCLQAAPFELAQVISAIRAHSAPKSMLCVGVDSAGAERFLAEELGIMSIRFTEGSEHPAFERNGAALQSAGIAKAKCEVFDLVVIRGESALQGFEGSKKHLKEGSVVVVMDTGIDAKQPACRDVWHNNRRAQMPLLHTHEMGCGVFMVKNMAALGPNTTPVVSETNDGGLEVVGRMDRVTGDIHLNSGETFLHAEGREKPKGKPGRPRKVTV